MPSYLEFEGKNVDMAIEKACKKLGVTKEKLKHEIITHGSTGIFGLVGTKKARIRVFLPDERIKQKSEKKAPNSGKKPQKPEIPKAAAKESEPNASEEMAGAADYGKEVVQKILKAISPEATVSVEMGKEKIFYTISGGNSGVLIGKRGQTLEAIQYIVEKIVNKNIKERVRIQIDIEGYLESRRDSLRELAGKMADKAKKTGKPVTVGHMTANDRRIVHLALKKDKTVRTQSMGDGFVKKLVIFPKKNQPKKKNNNEIVNMATSDEKR